MPDPLAPFEDAVVAAVADEHGFDASALEELLARHQSLLRGHGELTVADLVYEWRTQLAEDPLLARERDVFYLAPPEHVWADLTGRLALDDREAAALRDAHARQFEAARGEVPAGALIAVVD